ncbi:hypothetical protein PPACK8108_LOCUS11199, partial [Phakopsora pachyrhizi]
MSTWPDAKTGAGLEKRTVAFPSRSQQMCLRGEITRWVVRSRVTKVVRVVRLEGGLGGGSAKFVDGELDCARRLPVEKELEFDGEVGDRRALKYGEPREKLFLAKSVEDEAWGIRDRLGGGRMRVGGDTAGSGPMANATAAVVEDDCGSAVASVSAAAAAATVDDGTDRVRFVKGGDHPRGWIWDGMGVSVFAQSRVSDRLIEGDNVVDEGEIVTKAYHNYPYTVLNRIKHVEQTIPLFSSSEKIGPFLEWFKVDMEWVRGVGWVWVWGDDGMSSVTRVSYHMLRHPSEATLACHIPG